MQILDRNSGSLVLADQRFGERMGVVGRIIQNLDLQKFLRVFHLADFFKQPFHHIALVIERKLNGHARKLGPGRHRFRRDVPSVFHILPYHLQPVTAVK